MTSLNRISVWSFSTLVALTPALIYWFIPVDDGEKPNPEDDGDKPNIVLIFTDDQGYADLSCQGVVEDIQTPHIDALAKGGVRMTSGYTTAPQCVPARAGILVGRYQNRFGIENNLASMDGFKSQETVASRLRNTGYATGMIGKWHLGPPSEVSEHGFDDVFYRQGIWANFNLAGDDVPAGYRHPKLHHIEAMSAAARTFIQRHHSEPFFLYLAYRSPHVPLDAPGQYLDRFPKETSWRRRQALAMMSAVDDGVGGVMQSLRKYDIEERTLVFFISDNGAPLMVHKSDGPGASSGWNGSLNEPFSGEKGMLSEGGIRVPFIVYWKGRLPEDRVYDAPVITLDVAATALSIAGLPADPLGDGVDLIPYLSGAVDEVPHPTLYWRWGRQAAALELNWKFIRAGNRDFLFDLDQDQEEKHNLIESHPKIAERILSNLESWADELDPPGLSTDRLGLMIERYFEFYHDGKLPPAMVVRPRLVFSEIVFKRSDKNKDGRLTLGELLSSQRMKNASNLVKRFQSLDKNKDKELTLQEFTEQQL